MLQRSFKSCPFYEAVAQALVMRAAWADLVRTRDHGLHPQGSEQEELELQKCWWTQH